MTLYIEDLEFTNFYKAVSFLEEEYGYCGLAWEMLVASADFNILVDFLAEDGVNVELS